MSQIDKASVSYEAGIVEDLRADPDFAAEYLRAALEDEENPEALLMALRHVAKALGVSEVAEKAGVNRESLYRALSPRGNPTLKTLRAVTKAMGLRVTVEKIGPQAHPAH
ncbi:addiction module antidote protein [Fundidesulfovibrio agrisoli]|uniref:addiction module antidote protein n=1 Tax=Fundidesulfovibrio agrisoli TaxID=2922717 RepID=UPI001FAD65CC|nr:addiction module antidote protein [Fundidesulfovibrio agrisoli]